MRTDDFNFDLPEELVAQFPTKERGASRLMVLDRTTGTISHAMVADVADFIEPGTLMVFNDSKVRKARLYGKALDTGAEVEFLLLSAASGEGNVVGGTDQWICMCSKANRQRIGREYVFPHGISGKIVNQRGENRVLSFSQPIGDAYLDENGHIPLPPYIRRGDSALDETRYQTVYAKRTGSAACPTAGLHFTEGILDSLRSRDVEMAWVTLHVGLGTFLPVRADRVEDHVMHEEWYQVSEAAAQAVTRAKREGRKVLAVGTTSLRTLESAWTNDGLLETTSKTSIFIYPGYSFKVVDLLFTNFHTPKSTLLMLVSAFAGRERILEAYREAVSGRYRFFSYGDGMLIR
ncbi:MAG: S-adenosylmethionine:tRNA ribosyltransferase-isomerase [Spirochaetes bacterium]|nr:MAG: S-adenosylmethionine:tRNA ribosyltransferase-isomerase [Spirochaetota bacterium]